MNNKVLTKKLNNHKKWLNGQGGKMANLSGAVLHGVITNSETKFFSLQCPESGSYIAYKNVGGLIVELEIPEDAKRSSATSRKCRASKAKVLSITTVIGDGAGVKSVVSDYDSSFIYTVGETVEVQDFCEDRWKECAPGIHHFMTRQEAVDYKN